MPTRYKLLFLGQSVIFTMAIWIRQQDVQKAQHIKRLAEEAEKQTNADGSVANDGSSQN